MADKTAGTAEFGPNGPKFDHKNRRRASRALGAVRLLNFEQIGDIEMRRSLTRRAGGSGL
jgi:hypothetical protein